MLSYLAGLLQEVGLIKKDAESPWFPKENDLPVVFHIYVNSGRVDDALSPEVRKFTKKELGFSFHNRFGEDFTKKKWSCSSNTC